MSSLISPNGGIALTPPGNPVPLTLEAVVNRIPVRSLVQVDDHIYHSTTHVDGEQGVPWTPYVFHKDGKLNHTGSDIFNVWKHKDLDGGRIIELQTF